jgi:uncharacterized SAM-binding protein YcdF (DUF218 family)
MSKATEILIVLGSPNSPQGELSNISIDRLNYCLQHFNKEKLILCTGGFGVHFNTTSTPHATYAKVYLLSKGITDKHFLELALSSNTVEDAVKIKLVLAELTNIRLTIISSDYHIKRVQYIFNEVLKEYPKKYIGVESNLSKNELKTLNQHEEKALESIMKNGLYF